jgi:hypothetical protein
MLMYMPSDPHLHRSRETPSRFTDPLTALLEFRVPTKMSFATGFVTYVERNMESLLLLLG